MEYIGFMGIGALVLAFVQHILRRRDRELDRRVVERKEAYSGFLNAILTLRYDETLSESDVSLRYWVARVQLVCSTEVLEYISELEGSSRKAFTTKLKIDWLILAMRRDLSITT